MIYAQESDHFGDIKQTNVHTGTFFNKDVIS
jgi:hypothetical protein